MRVLIVDDDADYRWLVRASLSEHPGFEVVGEAGDGTEAIRLAETLAPDLVLMDLSMPVMGGLEAMRGIRGCCPEVAVVFLTGAPEGAEADAVAGACIDKARFSAPVLLKILGA